MKKLLQLFVIALFVVGSLGAGPLQAAEVKEYVVPAFADFSGAYADAMKFLLPVRDGVIAWWNDTEGKNLGMKLVIKNYDTRYDPTVVASLWPGILVDKPFIVAGLGGADVAALQQRLPKDQVPVLYAPAAYGYGWLPNQWIFQPRPTYAHEQVAGIMWYIGQHPEKKPLRIASMAFQGSPALIDIQRGIKTYIKNVLEPKGLATLVTEEWIDMQPVDVSAQYRNIVEKKADLVFGLANTTQAGAYLKACQLLGVSIPTIAAPHHTIWPLGMAMKNFAPWEGHMVVGAVASSATKSGPTYEFFKVLQKYNPKINETIHWSPFGMLGISGGVFLVRAIEHAAKELGPENLTGKGVYESFFKKPFTEEELHGVFPTLYFTKEAPFSLKDLKVKISTVKDGKYTLATPDWVPVPGDITKW
ncbi:MAG: ABC transporter substrate-binding protein [Proteobacteria bacterium]|nr:ABC transporter substrate-binding protein [Pseudomonadota bacterium]